MTNSNDPAFTHQRDFLGPAQRSCGLTKREYLAAMAMQGLCLHREIYLEGSGKLPAEAIACMALVHADALIAELNREPKQ